MPAASRAAWSSASRSRLALTRSSRSRRAAKKRWANSMSGSAARAFPRKTRSTWKTSWGKSLLSCVSSLIPARVRKRWNARGGVPPLHLSFKSKTPYYPLRFSSRQGVFDINLYVLTKEKFDYQASSLSLKRINWHKDARMRRNVKVKADSFPKTLENVYEKSRFKDYNGTWYLNVLRTEQVNQGNTIAKWKTDIFFKTQG